MPRPYHAAAIALVLLATPASAEPPKPLSHDAEIKTFAATVAIAQAASDRCADILINLPMLRTIRSELHIVDEVDRPALVQQGRQVMAVLVKAIADAPSPQAWCDATYRLYGPDGEIVPRLMLRR